MNRIGFPPEPKKHCYRRFRLGLGERIASLDVNKITGRLQMIAAWLQFEVEMGRKKEMMASGSVSSPFRQVYVHGGAKLDRTTGLYRIRSEIVG